jgi:hypothetical protein
VHESDIVTATSLFIDWYTYVLPREKLELLNVKLFYYMARHLQQRQVQLDFTEHPTVPNWERGVVFAQACSYRQNIVYAHGGSYLSPHISTNANRKLLEPPLQDVNLRVHVSDRSLCGMVDPTRAQWFVYASTARGANVKDVSALSENVAACFSSLARVTGPANAPHFGRAFVEHLAHHPGELLPTPMLQAVRPLQSFPINQQIC